MFPDSVRFSPPFAAVYRADPRLARKQTDHHRPDLRVVGFRLILCYRWFDKLFLLET